MEELVTEGWKGRLKLRKFDRHHRPSLEDVDEGGRFLLYRRDGLLRVDQAC